MFIERSWDRIRAVRLAFLLLGVLPCAGLGAWAALRHSPSHRAAMEERFSQGVGLPVRIGRIEHLRPGAVRARDVEVALPGGDPPVRLPAVELEWSAAELRMRLGSLELEPGVVRAAAGLARDWLVQPARFPHDCVIEVAACGVAGRPTAAVNGRAVDAGGGMRIECVAAHGSRAVRVIRHGPAVVGDDEIRAVAEGPAGDKGLQVSGRIGGAIPWPLVAAAAGLDERAIPLGVEAGLSGTFEVTVNGGRVDGSASGLCERIDAATATSGLADGVTGLVTLEVGNVLLRAGRIATLEATVAVSRGRCGQRLLDALVATIGCRPGPAFRTLDREPSRAFDEARMRILIDESGLTLRGPTGRATLAEVQALSILDEPGRVVPLERVAWLVSPASAPAVPASAATARLLEFLPLGTPAGPQAGVAVPAADRGDPSQAVRPRPRSGF